MLIGLLYVYLGVMPYRFSCGGAIGIGLPYHARFAGWLFFLLMCAVGYGEDALAGGNPFEPKPTGDEYGLPTAGLRLGGGSDVSTNEFTTLFLPLGVVGVVCCLAEWLRVRGLEERMRLGGELDGEPLLG